MIFYADPVGSVAEAVDKVREAMVIVSNVNANEYGYKGERAAILTQMYASLYSAEECWLKFLQAKDDSQRSGS